VSRQAGIRFSVNPQDEQEALAMFIAQGFSPARVEDEEDGVKTIVFRSMSDAEMSRFVAVAPRHLSAIQAVVSRKRSSIAS
jgi:hypothetical protein